MSKELRALERIKNFMSKNAVHWKQDIAMVETALKEYENLQLKHRSMTEQVFNDFKKLKALEIIKEKRVDVYSLIQSKTLGQYNNFYIGLSVQLLEQEEYDLLKEVLK